MRKDLTQRDSAARPPGRDVIAARLERRAGSDDPDIAHALIATSITRC
jgi:hypothetical protein